MLMLSWLDAFFDFDSMTANIIGVLVWAVKLFDMFRILCLGASDLRRHTSTDIGLDHPRSPVTQTIFQVSGTLTPVIVVVLRAEICDVA